MTGETVNLGILLRRRRKAKGLTLKAVAQMAGVSEGFVSQVENNVKSPSVNTLMSMCDAMGVEVGELMTQLRKHKRLFVVTKAEWESIDVPGSGFATRRFCPPDERETIDSAILIIEPGKSIPVRKNLKNAQEVLCVLRGELELIHGRQKLRMRPGDAAHIWAEPGGQSVTNLGAEPAVVVWVGTL